MALLSSKFDNEEYTGQITPYNGKVTAEIIKKSNNEWFKDNDIDLYYLTAHKSFGSMWNSAPREKDWIAANKWMDEQFEMMEKYATVMITKPVYITDIEKMDEMRKKAKNRD